ncbi:MAG: RNA polymerase sigma factor [Planctomycetota bacterium]
MAGQSAGGSQAERIARLSGAAGPLPEGFDPGDELAVDRSAGALLHRFREQDDVGAFTLLVELTQPRMARIARGITRQLAMAIDPDDLVASFMARLFTDVRRGQPLVRHFLALAHTSMRNDALNQLRQYKRAQARHEIWGRRRQAMAVADPARAASDKEQLSRLSRLGTVFLAVVGQCFHELSERDRRVLIAREVDRLSYDGMAEALGLPRGQIGMILKRAREHLAARIAKTFERLADGSAKTPGGAPGGTPGDTPGNSPGNAPGGTEAP